MRRSRMLAATGMLPVVQSEANGHKKIDRFAPGTFNQVRLNIVRSAVHEFQVFALDGPGK